MSRLFAGTLVQVGVLNETTSANYREGNAHPFAVADDLSRNFHKALNDQIASLARGEVHDVPVCSRDRSKLL
jgi:hypothetical protein